MTQAPGLPYVMQPTLNTEPERMTHALLHPYVMQPTLSTELSWCVTSLTGLSHDIADT